jgi:iron-sulfur cluster assembly protein
MTQTVELDSTGDATPIALTPAAVEYVERRRERLGKPQAALRVGVRGGGCAGLTYVTDFTEDSPREQDIVLSFGKVTVYLDRRSVRYIRGSTIDAENTLMYQGFRFDNPQQASACGCGSTFSVKR